MSVPARCVYAVPQSEEENPTLQPVGNDHEVACWVDVYADDETAATVARS